MKYAYVAGPYTAKTVKQIDKNIRNAWKVGNELNKKGFFPITPHCNSAHMRQDFDWVGGDIELMRRAADLLVLIPGWWDSPGAQKEAEAAIKLGLLIYYWPEDKGKLKALMEGE